MKTHFIASGSGFDVGVNFARATRNLPCVVAPDEYAQPRHVIAYVQADPQSALGFMRQANDPRGVRVQVLKQAVQSANH